MLTPSGHISSVLSLLTRVRPSMSEYLTFHFAGDPFDHFRPSMMKRSRFLLAVTTWLTCSQSLVSASNKRETPELSSRQVRQLLQSLRPQLEELLQNTRQARQTISVPNLLQLSPDQLRQLLSRNNLVHGNF